MESNNTIRSEMFIEYATEAITANAVEKLRMFANNKPYYGCFSGGKDSADRFLTGLISRKGGLISEELIQ